MVDSLLKFSRNNSGAKTIQISTIKTRIIGIDPGSRCTGYGVIDSDGLRHSYVTSGFIKVKGEDLPERLGFIFHEVSAVFKKMAAENHGYRTSVFE